MSSTLSDPPSRLPLLGVEGAAALMTAIVTSSSDAILSITLDGTVTSWNTATEELFGFSASEIVGEKIFKMIPEARRDDETAILGRIADGSRVETYETVMLTKDRRSLEVSVTISPIRSPTASIIGASSIIRDISDRKRAERSAAFLAAIVASTSDGVVSKTLAGIITSWNGAAERIFGFASDEMVDQSIRRIIPEDRQKEEDDILAKILAGSRVDNFETVRLRKDGHLIEVSITVSPIRDAKGNIIGASKIVRDITDKRATDKQLRTLLAEVNHRSKNLLALVQAVARQMAGSTDQLAVKAFLDRLQAIGRNQDLLIRSEWRALPIAELVRSQLAAFSSLIGNRITLDGPAIEVSPAHVQALGMAIGELGVNAAKHGALSNDSGRVSISWDVSAGEFSLRWRESGGPRAKPPRRIGFGSQVITTMLEFGLEGAVDLQYPESGLVWLFTCSLDRLVGRDG